MVKSNLLRVKPSELGDGWDVGCERKEESRMAALMEGLRM